MIDLHSRILPGLDDGATDLAGALEIARAAVADGITAIAATRHVREDYPTTADAMEGGVRQLRTALERDGIELELQPGGEVSPEQLDRLSHDELRRFGLGGNGNYLLIETPYWDWPPPFSEIVSRVRSLGMNPVIAHPERNPLSWPTSERSQPSSMRVRSSRLRPRPSTVGSDRARAPARASWLMPGSCI